MAQNNSIKLVFLGDISLNDDYVDMAENGGNPFTSIASELNGADLVLGNLECLLAGDGENKLKKPRLKTTEKALDILKPLNLGLVTLAHNHVYDNLESGFERTISYLEKSEITYVGTSSKSDEEGDIKYLNINGLNLSFINYVTLDTNPKIPDGAKLYPNIFDEKKIEEKVKEAKKQSDFVVLLLHWGGKVDYGFYPHHEQIKQAKRFVRAGADLIVGHHTHTFQVNQTIEGKQVFYSLGNFCFADIHTDGKISPIRNSGKESAFVQVEINALSKQYSSQIIPFKIDKLHLKPTPSLKSKLLWRQIKFLFVRFMPLSKELYYFYLKKVEPMEFYAEQSDKSFWEKLKGLNLGKLKQLIRAGK